MSTTFVFLDRDGVINRRPGKNFVTRPEELHFLPQVPEAIRRLNEAGLPVIVVTNQRGISLGLYDDAGLEAIHQHLRKELARHGARLDAIYYCPHGVRDACTCRKPNTGLFLQAAHDFPTVEFAASVVIGDSVRDLVPAARLGCRKVLIAEASDDIERKLAAKDIIPDYRCASLWEAVTQFVLPHAHATAIRRQ